MTDTASTAVERYEPRHHAPTGLTLPNPREMDALERLSKQFAASGLLLPHFKQKPEAVMAAALTCWSCDMPVNLQTINQFYEVNGKIQPGTQFCVALAARHGIEVWFDDACDDVHAIAYARNLPNGRVHRYEFTWAMAEKAKLTTKDNWKHPEIMLRYRASSRLLRTSFPETLMGLPPSVLDEGIEPVDRADLERQAIDVTDDDIADGELVDEDGWLDRFIVGCDTKLWPDDDQDVRAAKRAALVAFATEDRTAATDEIGEDERDAVESAFRGLHAGDLVMAPVEAGWAVTNADEEPFASQEPAAAFHPCCGHPIDGPHDVDCNGQASNEPTDAGTLDLGADAS